VGCCRHHTVLRPVLPLSTAIVVVMNQGGRWRGFILIHSSRTWHHLSQ
jgi:hypothetical protein